MRLLGAPQLPMAGGVVYAMKRCSNLTSSCRDAAARRSCLGSRNYSCYCRAATTVAPSSQHLLQTQRRIGAAGLCRMLQRCSVVQTASAACQAAWRGAATGRRPTFVEITSALATLGVSIDDDAKAVKRRYRELVKLNHPDAGGDEATMAKVTVAYDRLSSLTKREVEDYKSYRKAFGSGGGGGARAAAYRPATAADSSSRFRYAGPGSPFYAGQTATGSSQYYYQQGGGAGSANGPYQNQQSSAFWSSFYGGRQGGGGFAASPFSSTNPFSMHAQMQRARSIPSGSLLLQGLILYLFLSFLFLLVYRFYRDYRHDDGWRMSESLARHEQMEEMHRIRQEMNERARQMLQLRQQGSSSSSSYGDMMEDRGGGLGSGGRAVPHVGDTPEQQALEYARQRRILMMQEQKQQQEYELRGWPRIDEAKGRIFKRAQDPPGIVFFEPRKEDHLRRQIENQRLGYNRASQLAATAPKATPPLMKDEQPLPPESNVSSVLAQVVQSDAEANQVIQSIFGQLQKSQRES